MWMRRVLRAVMQMLSAQSLRHQHFDRLADQLVTVVTEQPFGLGIDQHDDPDAVGHHHAARAGFHRQTKFFLGENVSQLIVAHNELQTANRMTGSYRAFVHATNQFCRRRRNDLLRGGRSKQKSGYVQIIIAPAFAGRTPATGGKIALRTGSGYRSVCRTPYL